MMKVNYKKPYFIMIDNLVPVGAWRYKNGVAKVYT